MIAMLQWIPAPIRRFANRLLRTSNRFHGPYSGWAEARAKSTGYDSAGIVQRVLDSTKEVIDGAAAYEQDGIVFKRAEPNLMLLFSLALAAKRTREPIAVVDFGGALGSHFFRTRALSGLLGISSWSVVEQASFVAEGRRELSSIESLLFFETVEEACRPGEPHLLVASSVLQYLEHPMAALAVLASCGADVLFLDRTPFSDDDRMHCLVQDVARTTYRASYPAWMLSWSETRQVLAKDYDLVIDFSCQDEPVKLSGAKARYRGAVFVRRSLAKP